MKLQNSLHFFQRKVSTYLQTLRNADSSMQDCLNSLTLPRQMCLANKPATSLNQQKLMRKVTQPSPPTRQARSSHHPVVSRMCFSLCPRRKRLSVRAGSFQRTPLVACPLSPLGRHPRLDLSLVRERLDNGARRTGRRVRIHASPRDKCSLQHLPDRMNMQFYIPRPRPCYSSAPAPRRACNLSLRGAISVATPARTNTAIFSSYNPPATSIGATLIFRMNYKRPLPRPRALLI